MDMMLKDITRMVTIARDTTTKVSTMMVITAKD